MVRASLGSHVGKPSSAYGWSGGFSPGVSGFRPPLMNDRLDISEIFLKGSTLFALISEISTKHDKLYIGNGFVQRVKVDESTRQK